MYKWVGWARMGVGWGGVGEVALSAGVPEPVWAALCRMYTGRER